MYLCGLKLYTFFYLNAKEPKHQGLETPTKLSLYFLKSQKLVPLLSHPNSDNWYFLTKYNSTILNVCIPLADINHKDTKVFLKYHCF